MSVRWTSEQEQAIALRDANILVSAAAGSGKTAVLVERILSRVTDAAHPTDIDRLLIVTFTRAAATEMKTRIGAALEERLAADPDNEHLQRQSVLLHHAQICTIHSFCTYVIQNYYHRIALDPAYRIASDAELQLLRNEVIEELLEEEYTRAAEGENEAFVSLCEALSPKRDDRAIEEILQKISDFARSDPDPEAWLEKSKELVAATTEQEIEETVWMRELVQDARDRLAGLLAMAKTNRELAASPGGPKAYAAAMQSDVDLLEYLLGRGDYHLLRGRLNDCQFQRLSSKKPAEDESEELRTLVKNARETIKGGVEDLKKKSFAQSPAQILEQIALARPLTTELVRLVKTFLERFAQAKREKGVCDFSDLEHFALEILLKKTEAGWERTEAARELSLQFEEIMIDEYQDSNALQEIILEAVSREVDGRPNRFMVGDIKQSIYGFRMARPELFLEKYARYEKVEDPGRRVDLRSNFRSRREVLDIANAVFEKLMTGTLGGIVYDDAARLYPGADFPEPAEESPATAELLLVEEPTYEFLHDDRRAALEQTEALAVASRIRALVQQSRVYDKKTNAYRPARFGDCVVLLRSMSDTYVRVLQEAGVPAHADSREGYFSAIEIATTLNVLRICDNPRQDIPLAAVLRSPIVGMTDRELAELRCAYPDIALWDAVRSFAGQSPKLNSFVTQLDGFRDLATTLPIHELLLRILDETGYGLMAAAMPAGEQREANLRMLVEKAVEFEATNEHSLFRFIRTMEDMEKFKVDFGEVNIFGEGEDVVRVMTIHKSKGLEFPIVFVSNLGHGFNFTDTTKPVVMHEHLGMAMDAVDLEKRVRRTPLPKMFIRRCMTLDMLAEELRILYVAMTRAREKLILTGTVKDAGKERSRARRGVDYECLTGAKCYLDWILPAIDAGAPIREVAVDPEELYLAGKTEKGRRATVRQIVEDPDQAGDAEVRERLAKQAEFRYPYAYLSEMPAKLTVTELKRASLSSLAEEDGLPLLEEPVIIPYLPKFLQEETAAEGALRGTIYHRVWECLDYTGESTEEGIASQLREMVRDGKLAEAEAAVVRPKEILAFLESPLGARMREAAKDGRLRREAPFVFHIPAAEVDAKYPADESILIQGVIDACFEEDGKYILVDYKTDRAREADGSDLVKKYAVQLSLYSRALTQITEKEVGEIYIYSLSLGKAIPVSNTEMTE